MPVQRAAATKGETSSLPPTAGRSLRARQWALGAGCVLLVAAGILYWVTLDNGLHSGELIGGDLITHQYAQVQARPSNAPGYPIYTMGGWLWFHGLRSALALTGATAPNPLPILSSYSTVWALVALGLFYLILLRTTRSDTRPAGNWPLAWLLSAFYAVTYFFWYYATTTEQYTSAIAQSLAIFYVYLLWRDAVRREAAEQGPAAQPALTRSDRLLVLLAFLCGLSLAHMVTVAFMVPPLVVAVLWEQPRLLRNWRVIGLVIAAALLPLTSYVYVYLRGAAHPEWWGNGNWPDAGTWFWSFVSTAQGRDELSWGFQAGCAFFANGFPALIWQELSPVLLVIGLIGTAYLGRRPALVLYGTFVIYLIFNWMYRCGNWYQVILPVYPLLLIGAGALFDHWEQWLTARGRGWLRYFPHALLVAALVWRFAASWEGADSRDRPDDTALDRAAVLLDQPLPTAAGLFAPVADALALDYLTQIWNLRPDLRVVSSKQAAVMLKNSNRVLATIDAAPVLLSELPASLEPRRRMASPDWLTLTMEAPTPDDMPMVNTDLPVDAAVTLRGYRVEPAPSGHPVTTAAPAVDVTLYWQLDGEWPPEMGISLRPTADGQFIPDPRAGDGAIVQIDADVPMHGLSTSQAPNSMPIADAYRLPMPDGANGAMLLIYRRTGEAFENLVELPLSLE